MRARSVETTPRRRDRPPRQSKALLFAAAKDKELGYDAVINGRPNGAFTRIAIDALQGLSNTATYAGWLRRVRRKLPNEDWPQTPVLYGSDAQKAWRVFNGARRAIVLNE